MRSCPRAWMLPAALLAAAMLLGAAAQDAKEKGEKKLKVGDAFPDVTVEITNAKKVLGEEKKQVKIGDLKGKNVIVWFFPKAMTKG